MSTSSQGSKIMEVIEDHKKTIESSKKIIGMLNSPDIVSVSVSHIDGNENHTTCGMRVGAGIELDDTMTVEFKQLLAIWHSRNEGKIKCHQVVIDAIEKLMS